MSSKKATSIQPKPPIDPPLPPDETTPPIDPPLPPDETTPPIDPPLPPDETTPPVIKKVSIEWDGTTYTRDLIKKTFPEVTGFIELSWRNKNDTYATFNILKVGATISRDKAGNLIQK